MKYTVCDKCGTKLDTTNGVLAFFSTEKQDEPLYEIDGEYYYQIKIKYDLCERCFGLLHNWISEPLAEDSEAAAPQPENPDNHPVDGDGDTNEQ